MFVYSRLFAKALPGIIRQNGLSVSSLNVFIVELALKFSPFPVLVERKESSQAENVYRQVREAMEKGHPKLLELICEKVEGKKVTVLVSEIISIQIYEKDSALGGNKRPGFFLQE